MNYYAVARGRNPGIYQTWDDCKVQVYKFSNPIFKKFHSFNEAEDFIKLHSSHSSASTYNKSTNEKFFQPEPNSNNFSKNSTTLKRYLSTNSIDSQPRISKQLKTSKIQNGYSVDENGYTEVYTDGACSSNGRGNAQAGVGVWFGDRHPMNVSQAVVGRATNNMAEIQAVTVAAKQAQKAGIEKLKINTDSQFLISCITQWMPKWKRNGWMTASGKPVINKTELIEMEKAIAPLKVSFNHVKGHIGHYGNEMADKLAREGCEGYKQSK